MDKTTQMNTKSKRDVLSVKLQEENYFGLLKVYASKVRRVLCIPENDIILYVLRKLTNAAPKFKKSQKSEQVDTIALSGILAMQTKTPL